MGEKKDEIEVTSEMIEAGKWHALRIDTAGGMSDAQFAEIVTDIYRAMREAEAHPIATSRSLRPTPET